MPEPVRRCLVLLTATAIVLAGCAVQRTDASASLTPVASASASVALSTPVPTPSGTPAPTPTPDPSSLALEAISCEGGVVLTWSASTNPAFHHYTALRSPDRDIDPEWPPIAPAVDWGHSYATDPFVTSAVDASILPSDQRWNYRVMAYDAEGRVVAASPVRPAKLDEVADIGPLRVEAVAGGRTRLEWRAYVGFSECFSSYRVLYAIGGVPSTVLSVISGQPTDTLETDALHAGTTYSLAVEAMRSTTLGSFVVARSDTVSYTVP